ncbi:hypothetical protein [Spiroplasma poulsonii]|uniref:hypothetical protein n=1 Tax=Spiroplasma poulsonii TaxID=2138 RepID=UPI001F4CEC8B|nr:hypothetical protein [Spiroplasma poulsonii]UNF61912.1 hypothetical protein MNU24_00120 [Spiroplasma poulsonii]
MGEIFLIKNSDFNNLLLKALINDYFNDKTIIIDATETQSNIKGTKTILFW